MGAYRASGGGGGGGGGGAAGDGMGDTDNKVHLDSTDGDNGDTSGRVYEGDKAGYRIPSTLSGCTAASPLPILDLLILLHKIATRTTTSATSIREPVAF